MFTNVLVLFISLVSQAAFADTVLVPGQSVKLAGQQVFCVAPAPQGSRFYCTCFNKTLSAPYELGTVRVVAKTAAAAVLKADAACKGEFGPYATSNDAGVSRCISD